jgi:hypothetical protein
MMLFCATQAKGAGEFGNNTMVLIIFFFAHDNKPLVYES